MLPATNGMFERFNGRVEDVLESHHFRSGNDLEQTLLRYLCLDNTHLPQAALKGRTPGHALKDWHRERPDLFRKHPHNHPGCARFPPIIECCESCAPSTRKQINESSP